MTFVGQGRGVDDGGRDIVRRSERRRQRYLGKDGLDFGGDKDILDERGDDGALADSLVTTNTDSDWYRVSLCNINKHSAYIPVAISQHYHDSLHGEVWQWKMQIRGYADAGTADYYR